MSQSHHSQSSEFEELSIGTVEGLQAFLRNAQLQYQRGLLKDEEALLAGDYEFGNRLTQSFHKVRTVTGRLVASLQQGGVVTTADAEALQRSYDVLIGTINNPFEQKQQPIQKTVEKNLVSPAVVAPQNKNERIAPEQKIESPLPPLPVSTPQQPQPKKDFTPTSPVVPLPVRPRTGMLSVGTVEEEAIDIKNKISVSDSSVRAVAEGQTSERRKRKRRKKKKSVPGTGGNSSMDVARALDQGRALLRKAQHDFPRPNMVQGMLFQELRDSVEQLELMTKKAQRGELKPALVEELLSHTRLVAIGIAEADEVEVGPKIPYKTVPIVTERVSEVIDTSTKKEPVHAVTFVPTSIASKRPDTTKRPIPKQLSQLSRPAEIHEVESLTELYLTAPKHRQFIAQFYSSPAGFERILDATITKIEATTIDHIDKWLGDVPASAFSFLKDMSVRELIKFADRSYEEISFDLKRENIKYDTFAEWRDLTDEMLTVVSHGEEMKFGQLFAHFMIEQAMQHDS